MHEHAPANRAPRQRYQPVRRVLLAVMAGDLAMAAAEILYGHLSGSLGMISDGLHSALHAFGGILGILGITLAARPPDAAHPYGYERYETLASMGIAAFMIVAVWGIVESAWERLHVRGATRVDAGSFAVMFGAILLTLLLAYWERAKGRRLGSGILLADAARVRADVLVTTAVLVGLVAVRVGFPIVDTLVSIVVAGAIARSAWRIVRGAARVLTDATVGNVDEIIAVARSVEGVAGCHNVRARGVGGMLRADLHVTVDPQMSVADSHAVAREVARRVRERVGGIAEVLVHVGPSTPEKT